MTTIWKYDNRNRENLDKLSPNTKAAAYKWYNKCIELGAEVLIYETIRTVEQQRRNVAKGASQTMKSYHITGQALDYVPIINGVDRWDNPSYRQGVWGQALQYAVKLGFTWGADWNKNGRTDDESFVDSPHLQFEYHGYGTDKVLDCPAPVAPTPTPGITAQVIVLATNLNIRTGPGTQYSSMGKAVKGRVYNVVGYKDDWHLCIIDDHTQAWMKGHAEDGTPYLALVR